MFVHMCPHGLNNPVVPFGIYTSFYFSLLLSYYFCIKLFFILCFRASTLTRTNGKVSCICDKRLQNLHTVNTWYTTNILKKHS